MDVRIMLYDTYVRDAYLLVSNNTIKTSDYNLCEYVISFVFFSKIVGTVVRTYTTKMLQLSKERFNFKIN